MREMELHFASCLQPQSVTGGAQLAHLERCVFVETATTFELCNSL